MQVALAGAIRRGAVGCLRARCRTPQTRSRDRFGGPDELNSDGMLSLIDAILILCKAHHRQDDAAFIATIREVIEGERRANRTVCAAELERVLNSTASAPKLPKRGAFTPVNGSLSTPRDKDKDLPLVELSEPRRALDSLILSDNTRTPLDRIVAEWRRADTLAAFGLHPVRKVLLCGPPGCGKSATAEALATALRMPLATIRLDASISSFLGETASNLRKVFEYARTHPVVLFFDEFDAIGKDRTAQEDHGEIKRVVNSFLQLLDGFRADTLTVAATNHQGMLDGAVWRRFDEVVSFPLPSRVQIESLLARLFRQFNLEPGVKLTELSRELAGVSHADVERMAIDAMKTSVMASLERVPAAALADAAARLRQRLTLSRPSDGDVSVPPRRRTSRKRPTE